MTDEHWVAVDLSRLTEESRNMLPSSFFPINLYSDNYERFNRFLSDVNPITGKHIGYVFKMTVDDYGSDDIESPPSDEEEAWTFGPVHWWYLRHNSWLPSMCPHHHRRLTLLIQTGLVIMVD